MSLRYRDFDLQIERAGKKFSARASSPAGESRCVFVLPFRGTELRDLIRQVGLRGSVIRGVASPEMAAARELGGRLFNAVFGARLLTSLRENMAATRQNPDEGLRIRLRLQAVPELADLPWEYLLDTEEDSFLAQSDRTLIVRYVEMPSNVQALRVALPLRLLAVAACPRGFPPLDVAREKAMLAKAVEQLSESGNLDVVWLDDATISGLQDILRAKRFHMLHFIGHGAFDEKSQSGSLYFQDNSAESAGTDARRVGTLLRDHRWLRLAVLNACEGARNSPTDSFAGVATTLARVGIPAVVAMQFKITDPSAILFASKYYGALAQGLPVDVAMVEARKAMYLRGTDVEWGTPVLYMRSRDGLLFNIKRQGHLLERRTPRKAMHSASAHANQRVVFISASHEEFRDLRAMLRSQLDGGQLRVVLADRARARGAKSLERDWRRLLDGADFYVGILGRQYDAGTIEECQRAREQRKPCFVYLQESVPRDAQLQQFIKRELEQAMDVRYRPFSDAAGLALMIVRDVLELLLVADRSEGARVREVSELR